MFKRIDNIEAVLVVDKVNKLLVRLQINIVDNSNIDNQERSCQGLHQNSNRSSKLAGNFMRKNKKV